MEKNAVIQKLEEVVGTDFLPYFSGEIKSSGTTECKIEEDIGSVYGFAIKIAPNTKEKKEELFNRLKQDDRLNGNVSTSDKWYSIGDDWYPLYWGEDCEIGSRIRDHVKDHVKNWSLQLNKCEPLKGQTVIYGVYPCRNRIKNEKKLKEKYPDILKTKTKTKENN